MNENEKNTEINNSDEKTVFNDADQQNDNSQTEDTTQLQSDNNAIENVPDKEEPDEIKDDPEYITTDDPENRSEESSEPIEEEPFVESVKRPKSLIAACIISGCAILLLVAFAISLTAGIFPIKGKDVITIGVSNEGQTQPDVSASSELLEDFLNSVVIVYGKTELGSSTGTGVIISEDGYIITNHHVIENTNSVSIYLYGEKKAVPAEIVGFKEEDDVAVLKINKSGLRAAIFANSEDSRYGEKVYAVGTPEGSEFGWTITQGIISCPDRQLMFYDTEGTLKKKMHVVQTDASVNHGNSGGPLINSRGEIVGIVTLKLSDSAGMGFALPADGVRIDAEAIIQNGHANDVDSGITRTRPLIGITGVGVEEKTWYKNVVTASGSSIKEVDEEYAKENPDTTFYAEITGVYVSDTNPALNAARHIRRGDIITKVNGIPVTNIYEVMTIINQYDGGDTVSIEYYRLGEYLNADIVLVNE